MYLSPRKKLFVDTASEMFGDGAVISKQNVREAAEKAEVPFPTWFMKPDFKHAYGVYKLPSEGGSVAPVVANAVDAVPDTSTVNLVATNMDKQNLIPSLFDGFVSWGHFSTIEKVVKSGLFYPIFVTGLSGNGKTMNVTQACALAKRECIRVNITIETDEDDLLGGYRLQDGQTVWQNGPVIEAMERGALLLLDEIDLASNKIMCLQPILEGNGVFLKKINRFVKPAKGFNVIATANTKGQGSEDGKFIGTNILNEAFLERFPITIEQAYPTNKIENKILLNVMSEKGYSKDTLPVEFAKDLVTWADIIRKTFYEGGVDELISTRRLVHIVEAFSIFKNKMKAIEMCTNRFDLDTKTSFLDLYTKIDGGEDVSSWSSSGDFEPEVESDDDEDGNVNY